MAETCVRVPTWDASLSMQENVTTNLAIIEQAINAPELDGLLDAWNLSAPTRESRDLLVWLSDVADAQWDFRQGRERNQVGDVEFSDKQNAAIEAASTALGLRVPSAPTRPNYDVVFVLGGLLRGCLSRWRTAYELVGNGLHVTSIVGLGGTRALTGPELEQGAALGINGATEFDAMAGALELTFAPQTVPQCEVHEDRDMPNASWAITRFDDCVPQLAVAAAPSSEPAVRRANTADTIEWWLHRSSSSIHHVNLMITHPIYVPYQAAVAVRTLGLAKNTTVEFTGTTPTASNLGAITQHFAPHNYLQEIGSTLRGYRQLYEALDAAQA